MGVSYTVSVGFGIQLELDRAPLRAKEKIQKKVFKRLAADTQEQYQDHRSFFNEDSYEAYTLIEGMERLSYGFVGDPYQEHSYNQRLGDPGNFVVYVADSHTEDIDPPGVRELRPFAELDPEALEDLRLLRKLAGATTKPAWLLVSTIG